ncbi:glycoside hydrolase family 2 TIM barrel-domain containing protein [Mucilaginibacter sp. cycad4]|uniref:sugar-binding domain-containing protein n=1 Tax=Mucilaginibacter sp. cycad4 TaxID=3342096 RepID=UPI002AAC438D|nr:sugar-binding domain-containing protein [Mucilaginibacter gossypii]WPV02004.1 glycoside hydrolase family 2 TIM barrel-domain containing protein [Mucilaginibacter gossypii]
MKQLFLLVAICWFCLPARAQDSRGIPFDKDWRFKKDSVIRAENPSYNDAGWRKLDLPHDWSIEDLPNQKMGEVQGPFSKNAMSKGATGYTEGGIGWYRKTFTLEKSYSGKQIYITFDGVYMNSDVWINGHHLGYRPNGYISFFYDLTPYLNPVGTSNVIAVRVKNRGVNSRWYSGSGIYRHVWLTPVNLVHAEIWGSSITTSEVSGKTALVKVEGVIKNASSQNKNVNVRIDLINPEGKLIAAKTEAVYLDAGNTHLISQQLTVTKPSLWSLENPSLYKAKVTVMGGKSIDKTITSFGIRKIEFDGAKGFLLNGKSVKLKGGCIHHDNGPLGATSIDRAEERKIELLKKAGYNAVRLSHNPYAPALLNACDRLGMLVVTDSYDMWEQEKSPVKDGYNLYFKKWWQKDLQALIFRDRNHPSIIMWGIGNEIPEAADTSGYRIAKELADEVHRLDPTRPVTEAIVYFPGYSSAKNWEQYKPHLKVLDVDGYNYAIAGKAGPLSNNKAPDRYETEHAKHPEKTFMATEYFPVAALENWDAAEKHPYVLGGFSWTAMNYIGEAFIGGASKVPDTANYMRVMMNATVNPWPVYGAVCGDLDIIGNRRAASYYQNVVWRNTPVEVLVHRPMAAGMKEITSPWGFPDLLKSWTWPGKESQKMQVQVYTRSKQVKLELNGKIIAEQTVPDGSITATFEVEYQPGTLTAKGFTNGKETGESMLHTTGRPVAIRLIPDRKIIKADVNDLSFVNVEVVDDKGNVVPDADDIEIRYELNEAGKIAGVGNGNPADVSSFQQNHKKVFQGRGLVIVRPNVKPGAIVLHASADGLRSAKVIIEAR